MSTTSSATATETVTGSEPSTDLIIGGAYALANGTLVEPSPAILAYLQALTDTGIRYERDLTIPNVLAFRFNVNTRTGWATRYAVQYPKWDDAYAEETADYPHVQYAFVSFATNWPELSCIVSGGGTLGIWPAAVREELQLSDSLDCLVNLVTGSVMSLPGDEDDDTDPDDVEDDSANKNPSDVEEGGAGR